MTILVTGATGYIGSRFVTRLRENHGDILALVRPSSRTDVLQKNQIRHIACDFSDACVLSAILARHRVKTVIHIAGPGLTDIKSGKESSCEGISALLEAAKSNGVEKFIYLSSIKAKYQELIREGRLSEDFQDLYAAKKLIEEEILIQQASPMKWSIIRAPAVYGPLDKKSWMIFKISQGWLVPLLPEKYCSRFSVIHVDDLVDKLLLSLETGELDNRLLEVGNATPLTWNDIVAILATASSIKITVPYFLLKGILKIIRAVARRLDVQASILVADRIDDFTVNEWLADTGCELYARCGASRIPVRKGLLSSLDEYRKHGWLKIKP